MNGDFYHDFYGCYGYVCRKNITISLKRDNLSRENHIRIFRAVAILRNELHRL
jgi:hypothetical protein